MAKLYFRYGAMGASKTANALMVEYNYRERGQHAVLYKPAVDTRDGEDVIVSRTGISRKSKLIFKETDLFKEIRKDNSGKKIDCVIIDEAQFLSKEQVEQLCIVVENMNIPVITYGLRTDFRGDLFEGSKWLLAWAETIEEIKTVCFCSKKAIMNTRLQNGLVVKEGEQVQIGGNESYIALCRKHWRQGITE